MITPSSTLKAQKERFILLDLIRLIAVLAIIPFHLSEFSFDSESHPIYLAARFNHWMMNFGKTLPFSGLTVVFVSFFLLGFRKFDLRKFIFLCAWCVLGYFILLFAYYDWPYPFFYWDIFSFLIVTFAFAYFVNHLPGKLWLTGVLSLVAIITDFNGLPSFVCGPDAKVSWPLFPWIFIASFFLFLGQFVAAKRKSLRLVRAGLIPTLLLLMGTLICGFLLLPDMNLAPATSGMYCFIQGLSIVKKLSIIIFLGIWCLAATNFQLNDFLKRTPLSLISKSIWNKNFGLAYLIQIGLIGLITTFSEIFLSSGLAYDLSLLAILVFTEFFGFLLRGVRQRANHPG